MCRKTNMTKEDVEFLKALFMIDMNNGFVNFGPMANPKYNDLVPEQQALIEMFREEDVDYQVGDFVYHETFGTGKVVEVTNTLVSVAFKHPHGIKKLMKNHKKLSKV